MYLVIRHDLAEQLLMWCLTTISHSLWPLSVSVTAKVASSVCHGMIKFVSDIWEVCGFLKVFCFPLPTKLI
jgi:hypothetical protein